MTVYMKEWGAARRSDLVTEEFNKVAEAFTKSDPDGTGKPNA